MPIPLVFWKGMAPPVHGIKVCFVQSFVILQRDCYNFHKTYLRRLS